MSMYAMANALMTPDLTDLQCKVYAYLVCRANGARVCWPSVGDIAADLNVSERRVSSATKALVESGRIKVTKRHKDTNNYFVMEVPGLYDRPLWSDRKRSAPDSSPCGCDADLTQTTGDANNGEEPVMGDANDTPEPVRGDANDTLEPVLPRQKEHSGVTQTTLPSIEQESNKISTSLRSVARVARATRLSEDWVLPDADRRYAIAHGIDPDRAAEDFRNYWLNRTGRGSTMISWSRAFQNRVLQLQDSGRCQLGGKPCQQSKFASIHAKLGTTSLWATMNDPDDGAIEVDPEPQFLLDNRR